MSLVQLLLGSQLAVTLSGALHAFTMAVPGVQRVTRRQAVYVTVASALGVILLSAYVPKISLFRVPATLPTRCEQVLPATKCGPVKAKP